jgi:hypothetical protein
MTTLVTSAELSNGGIVVTDSVMNYESSGLVRVEASFAYRTQDFGKYQRAFEKGSEPPTRLSRLNFSRLQNGSIYLTDASIEENYGITSVTANYAGARSINIQDIDLTITSSTRSVTYQAGGSTYTIPGQAASYSVRSTQASSYGAIIANRPESVVQNNARRSGGVIRPPANTALTYNPARPAQSRTRSSRTALDAIFNVYEYAYTYALVDGKSPPRLQHRLIDLVQVAAGSIPTRTGVESFTQIINSQITRINSRVSIHRKIFTADKLI